MAEQFANLAQTQTTAQVNGSATTLPLANGASPFPSQAQFRVRVEDLVPGSGVNVELMLVTAGAGTNSWTVTRGIEGTSAVAHAAGSAVTHVVTAGALGTMAQSLVPTAVQSSAYAAAAGDFVPVDTTGGAVTVTLPSAPADKTRVGVKHVAQGGTNAVAVARGGSDVFNKAGGSTSLSLGLVNQSVMLQYAAAPGLWYVQSADLPQAAADLRYEQAANKGVAGGYAGLDSGGLLPAAQRPDTYGLLTNRPSVATAGDKGTYFATDDNGGTLYQVQSGAWVRVGPKGTELKYADSVSNQTGISTAADVTGLAISFTVADRPVMVEALLPLVGQVGSTGQPTFFIVNSTGVTTYATGQPATLAAGAFAGCPLMKARFAAGTGALSLKVTGVTTLGTVTVFSNSARKSYIQAYEV